ncbi:MAG: 4Fe-4S binding protein [Treponema sp.]|jgi:polyferredoxin|nr:4Fe-4S binding protein [Treponema sp.]
MNETVAQIGMFTLLVLLIIISGRLFCGKICPLGLFQDLFSKIPFPIKIKSFKADKYLRYIKYAFLLIIVISFITGQTVQEPEDNTGRSPTATIIITALFVIIAIMRERFFCKYLCYFGAVIALGNKISLFKYRLDEKKCIQCGICVKNCKMNLEPQKTPNHPECIRCGKCKKVCPRNAITFKAGK